jgi:hypothetical protein
LPVRRNFTLVIALFLMVSGLLAQSGSDSVELSSFRKGRNLVGLSGSISSSYLTNANSANDNSQLGNVYRFDIRLGKFVADKNLVGLLFIASRTQMIGYVNTKAEVLGIGPWYRLYLGKEPNIAFYLQTNLLYSNYYGSSEGVQSFLTIDENLNVQGIWAALGIGLSYVMNDRVSFDVGFEYNQSRYWGVINNNITEESNDIVLDRGGFVFSFGFNVLFERLKKDD